MEICLICSTEKDNNGLVVCSKCNSPEACGACGELYNEDETHNCSEQTTLKGRLLKVIEILSTPEDSDEIWWCVGELETIVKEINTEKENA